MASKDTGLGSSQRQVSKLGYPNANLYRNLVYEGTRGLRFFLRKRFVLAEVGLVNRTSLITKPPMADQLYLRHTTHPLLPLLFDWLSQART